jgi:hypothetical protein
MAKALESRSHTVEVVETHVLLPDWQEHLTAEDGVTPKFDAVLTTGTLGVEGAPTFFPACLTWSMPQQVLLAAFVAMKVGPVLASRTTL